LDFLGHEPTAEGLATRQESRLHRAFAAAVHWTGPGEQALQMLREKRGVLFLRVLLTKIASALQRAVF
jgi:hypothetical protein